jgi:hypothetical protein
VQGKEDDEEDDEAESKEPALVMFDKNGKINLSLWSKQEYPAVNVEGARGHAGMQPGKVWVMSHDLKSAELRPE